MKEIIVENDNKKYFLNLIESNLVSVDVEYKSEKNDIGKYGFCPSNYNKKVIKKGHLNNIKLPNELREYNILRVRQLARDIQNIGYIKAVKKLDITPSERFKKELEKSKKEEHKKRNKYVMNTRELLNDSSCRSDISEYIYNEKEKGTYIYDIIALIEEKFEIKIAKTTVSRLYLEECSKRNVKPIKRGDFWKEHKEEIKRLIRKGKSEKEINEIFKTTYGEEIKHYHFYKAKGEIDGVRYV